MAESAATYIRKVNPKANPKVYPNVNEKAVIVSGTSIVSSPLRAPSSKVLTKSIVPGTFDAGNFVVEPLLSVTIKSPEPEATICTSAAW